jgi:hypothetical protein
LGVVVAVVEDMNVSSASSSSAAAMRPPPSVSSLPPRPRGAGDDDEDEDGTRSAQQRARGPPMPPPPSSSSPPSTFSSPGAAVGEIAVAVPPPQAQAQAQAQADAADNDELPVAATAHAPATPSAATIRDDAAARAALAATAARVGAADFGAGATIPTTLRNWKNRNSNISKHGHSSGSSNSDKNKIKWTRDGTSQEEGELARGVVTASEGNPRHGSSSSPSSSSSKGSKRTTPANAQPHYRCARSTYESSIEAASKSSVFSSDEAMTAAREATPLSSPRAASLRFGPHFPPQPPPPPPPPQIPRPADHLERQRQRVSASSLWQACTAAPAAASSVSQLARRLLSQEPQEDTLSPMPTLEAMLLRQEQQKPALESMAGDIKGTKNVEAAAAPPRPVISLADLAPTGALLKPRRTSPAALPAYFEPSTVDVVVELMSESSAFRGSTSTSQSSGASTSTSSSSLSAASAPANACRRRAGSAPAYEAMLNRHLLAYIESTRRSRSHLVDHLLALVERSGGRFCRFDPSCHRWIQVGYETSFDVCASEFKAGARDVLKRIQLLRNLERQEKQESEVELIRGEQSAEMQLPTPVPRAQSQERGTVVLRAGHEHQSADSHSIYPKPPPGAQPWQGVSVMLHPPRTATSQDPPSSQLSFPGPIASNPDPPGCMKLREHKLQTKFKRPKMKASRSSACAAHPTSPMPRRVTNEQEPTTSADIVSEVTRPGNS